MNTVQLKNIGLDFSELVAAAGVSLSQAQNWISGRPLEIRPSISRAAGKGTRNIFSIYDAYLFAYLDLLRKKGFDTTTLQKLVSFFSVKSKDEAESNLQRCFQSNRKFLVIGISKMAIATASVEEFAPGNHQASPLQFHELYDDLAVQVAVNLEKLTTAVNDRAIKALAQSGKLVLKGTSK